MAQIRHIAIFSEDPKRLAEFYGSVFGTTTTGIDDLGNAWISDGLFNIALLRRRSEKAPPKGIHHWGFTITPEERPRILAGLREYGIAPYSPYVDSPEAHRPYAEDAVKDPDGNRFDLSTGMRAVRTEAGPSATAAAAEKSPALIRHIAIFSDDPARLAKFYVDVLGLRITGDSQGSVWVTEGHVDVALLRRRTETQKRGIHHWGWTLAPDAKPEIYRALAARGSAPRDPRLDDPTLNRPYVEEKATDPDGNRFDLTLGKRDMDEEKARTRVRLSTLEPAK